MDNKYLPDVLTHRTRPVDHRSAAAGPRPDRLRAELARQAMPSSGASGGAAGRAGLGGVGGHAPARGLEVVAAHYSNGVLLLAEAAAGESRTRLFMLSRQAVVPTAACRPACAAAPPRISAAARFPYPLGCGLRRTAVAPPQPTSLPWRATLAGT